MIAYYYNKIFMMKSQFQQSIHHKKNKPATQKKIYTLYRIIDMNHIIPKRILKNPELSPFGNMSN